MCTYSEFKSIMVMELEKRFDKTVWIEYENVKKNNGVILDSLCIKTVGASVSPAIYMEGYYQQYQDGTMTIDEITEDIYQIYINNPTVLETTRDWIQDFSKTRDMVRFKLVNAEANKELLTEIPYVPFLDLAIVFYLFLNHSDWGGMVTQINLQLLEEWGIGVDELKELAIENTQRELPAEIRSLDDVMYELMAQSLGKEDAAEMLKELLQDSNSSRPLYVLTNKADINGAGCILYSNVLKDFAEVIDGMWLFCRPAHTKCC